MSDSPRGEGPMMSVNLTVVIPAYNAAKFLPRSLSAWLELTPQVVVVDPGSHDGTADLAASLGARVLRLGHRAGPAEARNVGAAAVETEVVLFVDADCVPRGDVVARMAEAFAADDELVSLTGSYDDAPPERNFASLYMNLRHHAVHQHAKREGSSFWAGCGAVRRSVFAAAGGFDAARYPLPMVEDIELGMRLQPLGMTRLDPTILVTHLKRWTLGAAIWTDVFCRALPWSELIVQSRDMPRDLNLELRWRVAAALAPLALLALPTALLLTWAGWPLSAAAALLPLLLSLWLQRDLLRVFLRGGGAVFAALAWTFHQVHLIYRSAAFVWCLLFRRQRPAR
jgi:glycosyltransferase involved in cell wall biosynthesis